MPPRRRPPPAGARTDLPPLKIVRKILLLQAAYYVTATALILFTTLVYGTAFSLDLVLSWNALRGDTTLGWMLGLVWMLNSFLCVIFLLLLVSRSKLIPDFALTIHFLHLVTTSLYTHAIPSNLLWWGLQCASSAFMIFLGIWACRWRELQPISFGGIGASSTAQGSDQGSSRGHNAGGGEHEMVNMKGDGAV
ncbi:integral membrane protein S linking to the trans Golgi network-domain-containing protein [Aspergillus aurantiobrunneus]